MTNLRDYLRDMVIDTSIKTQKKGKRLTTDEIEELVEEYICYIVRRLVDYKP